MKDTRAGDKKNVIMPVACNRYPIYILEWLVLRRAYRNQVNTDWNLVQLSSLPVPVKLSNSYQQGKWVVNDSGSHVKDIVSLKI